jgi:hypothetical protein
MCDKIGNSESVLIPDKKIKKISGWHVHMQLKSENAIINLG